MRLYLKLAWRNLFRNKRRTFIAGTAIGIGLASLIYVDAIMIGMEENMIRSATASFLGEGQIHREGFRQTFEVEKTIANICNNSIFIYLINFLNINLKSILNPFRLL